MYIDFDIDVNRKQIPKYLNDIMDELDSYYKNNDEINFCQMLPNIITCTSGAEANHQINMKEYKLIRERYGLV